MKRNNLKYKILFASYMLLLITGCTPYFEADLPNIKKQIVVDGNIENGAYASVLLTYNTQYFANLDSASFRALVATRAKVTLSDGNRSEILTLMRDTNYFPPYVYRSVDIVGEVGKTYTLLVEDELDTVSAITTIPKPITLDSIWFSFYPKNDTSGIIKGIFQDNKDEVNYYKTFAKIVKHNKRFYPTLISNFEDNLFNGKQFTFSLQKGPESYLQIDKNLDFKIGDTILVKVTSIDKPTYEFWRSYEDEVLNSGNPFAANHNEIKSNIKNGLGIWCGYGATYYNIIAK